MFKRSSKVLILIFLLFYSNINALKRQVPTVFNTIQSALNACLPGDTVLVQPGNYNENIVWPLVDNLVLISSGDSSNTILNANYAGRCISQEISINTNLNAKIIGFKLTGGYVNNPLNYGCAILFKGTKIELDGVSISNNQLNILTQTNPNISNCYGGLCYFESKTILSNSSIYSNTVVCNGYSLLGGLLYTDDLKLKKTNVCKNTVVSNTNVNSSSGLVIFSKGINISVEETKIIHNSIHVNSTGSTNPLVGAFIFLSKNYNTRNFALQNTLISNNDIQINSSIALLDLVYNYGYGISTNTIKHCTIANNFVLNSLSNAINVKTFNFYCERPLGLCLGCKLDVSIVNSIIWNPALTNFAEITYSSGGQGGSVPINLDFRNSDIRNNSIGSNCINIDPYFISLNNLHLQSISPCVDVGDSSIKVQFDLDGIARPIGIYPDMGCFEYNPVLSLIDNVSERIDLTVYPNPTKDNLYILAKSSDLEFTNITIMNSIGIIVLSLPFSKRLDLSDLPKGVYNLKIDAKDKSVIKKIIKD